METIVTRGLTNNMLRQPLQIFWCPYAAQCGTPINEGIRQLVQQPNAKTWAGPVVVLKFKGTRREGYVDISETDLPTIAHCFS